jgi:adenylate cyclase
VFADIAGFTALTEAHGDHDAAALVADFCRSVRAELPASGGTEVKTIGDAVMLTIPDPAAAIRLGLRITHELMRGHGAPAVRVGLHHGPAIERDGDYFGAAAGESSERALLRHPVCRVAVDPERSAGRLAYEDTAYFFCSLACAAEFAGQPERFAREHS